LKFIKTPRSHLSLCGNRNKGNGISSKPQVSFARLDTSSSSIGWYLSRVPFPGFSVFGRDLIRIIGE